MSLETKDATKSSQMKKHNAILLIIQMLLKPKHSKAGVQVLKIRTLCYTIRNLLMLQESITLNGVDTKKDGDTAQLDWLTNKLNAIWTDTMTWKTHSVVILPQQRSTTLSLEKKKKESQDALTQQLLKAA